MSDSSEPTPQLDAASTEEARALEIIAFVGEARGAYYLERWRRKEREGPNRTGWNWPAGLISGFWLPFRRMYWATFFFYVCVFLIGILEHIVFIEILRMPDVPKAAERFIAGLIAIYVGVNGNRWYLSHAERIIAQCHAEGLEGQEFKDEISRRGGTSVLAVLAVVSIAFAVAFVTA